MKSFIKSLTPPVIQSQLKDRFFKKLGYFTGPYPSWAKALENAKGYQDPTILEKVKTATLQAMNQGQLFSRDATVNAKTQYAFAVFAALLKLIIENENRLTVLDFGGGLGSSYIAFKQFCPKNIHVKWEVVEQPAFVSCAKSLALLNEITFHENINSINNAPDVILLSATLQYIEKPYDLLNMLLGLGAKYLILDRTWCADYPTDRIIVEHVPEHIYKSSYPTWLFSCEKLMTFLSDKFDVLYEFDSIEGSFRKNGFDISGKGIIAIREES